MKVTASLLLIASLMHLMPTSGLSEAGESEFTLLSQEDTWNLFGFMLYLYIMHLQFHWNLS